MTRYELFERIGVGGMAEIFRGKAVAGRGFEKLVAIKRILPHLSQDKRFVELLITEAKTLSELKHRNIVQIYDVGLGDDGQYFIVMEFVVGMDLAGLLEQAIRTGRSLPLDATLYISAQVCEALEHAHNARDSTGALIGLVHRDVSPSNILLSKSGEVKLTDFGIAKRMEELTGHGGVRGKFAYISPEQAENQHVDGRSDVHSLGIVLFELLTNRPLFSHLPDSDALHSVRERKIPHIRDVDPSIDEGLANLVMKSLDAEPGRRYQSAKAFASALRDYRYGMVSSTGDPVQAVARAVTDAVAPPVRPPDDSLPPGEGTVVRILSSAGFPGATGRVLDPDNVSTDADPYSRARAAIDTFEEDDHTEIARTPVPELIPSHLDDATKLGRPFTRVNSDVDPDADTEYALSASEVASRRSAIGRGKSDSDEVELETRVLDRTDPAMMAAIANVAREGKAREGKSRGGRMPPLPSSRKPSEAEDVRTVPRAEPVRGPGTHAPEISSKSAAASESVSSLAPRSVHYPSAMRDDNRAINTASHDDRFLGMPRHIAYWVIGGAAAFLLVIIIVLLATRPSGGQSPPSPRDSGSSAIVPSASSGR